MGGSKNFCLLLLLLGFALLSKAQQDEQKKKDLETYDYFKTEWAKNRQQISDMNEKLLQLIELNANLPSNFKELRSEIIELNANLSSNFKELHSEIIELNANLSSNFKELHSESVELNANLSSNFKELRSEIIELNANLSSNFKELHSEIIELNASLSSNFKELRCEIINIKDLELFDQSLNYKSSCAQNQVLPKDCDEAMTAEGVYALQSTQTDRSSFGAYCVRHDGKGCTVIQRRQDGSVDFHRDWEAYKNGFGNLSGEYWLGLERMHALISEKEYKLWIQFESLEDETFTATYNTFSVAGENDGYRLRIARFYGNVTDAMVLSNGMKFSTFDVDNDLWGGGTCAGKRRCAWWHYRCSDCNLNGDYKPYTKLDGDNDNTGLWWNYGRYSLRNVQLALCPV